MDRQDEIRNDEEIADPNMTRDDPSDPPVAEHMPESDEAAGSER